MLVTVSASINSVLAFITSIESEPIKDVYNSAMIIGPTGYKGFIYSIELYTQAPIVQTIVSENCQGCSYCLPTGSCLPTCNITSFYSSSSSCLNCLDSCYYLCSDSNCYMCSSFNKNSCTQCNPNYELQNSLCVACFSSGFYNSSTQACIKCNSASYYNTINNTCSPCNSSSYYDNFTNTCKSFLCHDTNCYSCTSTQADSCIQCKLGFELQYSSCVPCFSLEFYNYTTETCIKCNSSSYYNTINNTCTSCNSSSHYDKTTNTCFECNSTSYYNSFTNSCHKCSSLCSSCSSAQICLSCVESSTLYQNSCQCNKDYSGTEKCLLTNFSAVITLNSSNIVTIIFSDSIILGKNNLTVSIDQITLLFSLATSDEVSYILTPSYSDDINSNTFLEISFLPIILSKNNLKLTTSRLSIKLYPSTSTSVQNKISAAKQLATKGVTIGLSVIFGTSIISFDPTSFFNFLNSAEIYAIIYMYGIPFHPVLTQFLATLRPQKFFPNLFKDSIDETKGVKLNENYSNYGLSTNFLLVNSGISFFILSLFLGIFLFLRILGFFSRFLKEQIKKLDGYFKYSIFLRFFLQTYLEISFNSIVELYYNTFNTGLLIVDGIIALMFIVKYI